MLVLKLLIVPSFLLLLSLAGRAWGASVAGWLAGLPVVAGPILYFIAMEQGALFASRAASVSLAAVLALVTFGAVYARSARHRAWPSSLLLALLSWAIAAFVLSWLPTYPLTSLCIALGTLLAAPRFFPMVQPSSHARPDRRSDLMLRMLAGASLTVLVTVVAGSVGQTWSGLLAVFPILSTVLAVFSHKSHGPIYASTLLRSMATGLYSFAAFCFALASALLHVSTAEAFSIAVVAALVTQAATRRGP